LKVCKLIKLWHTGVNYRAPKIKRGIKMETKAEIKINGKAYTLTGENPAYLKKLAQLVDKKVKALLKKDKMMSIEVASVLAAINIADDYYKIGSDLTEQKKETKICMDELTDAKTEINNLKIENEMLKLQLGKLNSNEED